MNIKNTKKKLGQPTKIFDTCGVKGISDDDFTSDENLYMKPRAG